MIHLYLVTDGDINMTGKNIYKHIYCITSLVLACYKLCMHQAAPVSVDKEHFLIRSIEILQSWSKTDL